MSNMSTKPRIVFFLEGESVPASRFRVRQFEEVLEAYGIQSVFLTTRPSKYLFVPSWLKRSRVLSSALLGSELLWITVQRIYQAVRYLPAADVVVLQRDLLHRISVPFLERLILMLSRGKRKIFDVDDAIFLDKRGELSAKLAAKLKSICMRCDLVLAGNGFLRDFFNEFATCEVVPTVIDTDLFSKRGGINKRSQVSVLCWTGSASNLDYLRPLEETFNRVARTNAFVFRVIADAGARPPFVSPQFEVDMRTWSPQTEVQDLEGVDIGIMPLPPTSWSRGKCGFKLLQYMAMELPCIASAIGVNTEIVVPGDTGLLVSSSSDWEQALVTLLCDSDLRRKMGVSGRARVVERYSVASLRSRWIKLLLPSLDSIK